jgi:hypothetical protein
MAEELYTYNPKLYIQFNVIMLIKTGGEKLGKIQMLFQLNPELTENEILKEKTEFFEVIVQLYNILGVKKTYRLNEDKTLKYPRLAEFEEYIWGDGKVSNIKLSDMRKLYREMRYFCEDLGFTKTEGLQEKSKITRLIKGGMV